MTYKISISLVYNAEFQDTLTFTCERSYDARVMIESLCNGWQMDSKHIVMINGQFLAFGSPREIRAALSVQAMQDWLLVDTSVPA